MGIIIKTTKINNQIDYIEPDAFVNFTTCSGLIIHGNPKIVIDTNMGQAQTEALLLKERPDIAIITHYHLDHATWGHLVLTCSSAALFLPQGEEEYFTNKKYFIDKSGIKDPGLKSMWANFMEHTTGYKPISGFNLYNGGDIFSNDHTTIRTISTPGHSPFHKSFYFPDENMIFTGDMGVDRFGPWYGWTDCNLADLVRSIFLLKSLNAGMLVTSHGGIINDDIAGTFDSKIDQIFARENKIIKRIEKGLSREEIINEGIYYKKDKSGVKEPMRSFLLLWDSIMFDHHKKAIDKGGLSSAIV